ncbi:MAG: transcriptional regulator [Candidatus Bathyarchaeota archaeon]|nr:transcriptional regulator [Candidatus Bathyarchaeota archaeon]
MDDKVSGYAILFGSLLGIACYFYLVFLSPWALLVVRISAFLAVAAVLVIVAWIGYTLATTPLPEPLDLSLDDSLEENRSELEA